MLNIQSFLDEVKLWAKTQKDIEAVILVGSQARGTARDDSDIDVMILSSNPKPYLQNTNWINQFGQVQSMSDEDYKAVIAKRVFFENGLEVEFDFSTPDWLKTNPIDSGTRRVMSDGYKIILDKTGVIENFVKKL